jgi:uncharacterized membrane protein
MKLTAAQEQVVAYLAKRGGSGCIARSVMLEHFTAYCFSDIWRAVKSLERRGIVQPVGSRIAGLWRLV